MTASGQKKEPLQYAMSFSETFMKKKTEEKNIIVEQIYEELKKIPEAKREDIEALFD